MLKIIGFAILFSAFAIFAHSQDCIARNYPNGTVCVCNSTYCDTVPSLNVTSGNYQLYSTSQSTAGFYSNINSFASNGTVETNTIIVDKSTQYQSIIGFGGAFTDATGININSLPVAAQDKLLESYFSDSGIGYNLCRVPIGGTDFSTRAYSYDDVALDITLSSFALQPEDINYKIPYIQKALSLRNNSLNLYGSAWTAPPWMKTNGNWSGIGSLEVQYYPVWANYYIKFLDEYEKNNITFWGLTTQNEPLDGFFPSFISEVNSMGWTPSMLDTWISLNLGPTLSSSVHKDVKILIHDDQRLSLPLLQLLLLDPLTMSYVDGVGVHWYTDTLVPAQVLETIKSPFKDLFVIGTEACNGFLSALGVEPVVDLGSWQRAASYITDILDDLQYGLSGWVDWNMVLDETGGPNYVNNFVDSPIIVNATLQEFYKQPMFYALGHFSKFVIPGSVLLETTLIIRQHCYTSIGIPKTGQFDSFSNI